MTGRCVEAWAHVRWGHLGGCCGAYLRGRPLGGPMRTTLPTTRSSARLRGWPKKRPTRFR